MNRISAIIALSAALLCSCTSHFISDSRYRKVVRDDFSARSVLLEKAGADIASMGLSPDEYEAMEFLYAYMPLGDILNMKPEYWVENYRLTKEALAMMPWGRDIPEREVRHFVLPVRVNNENLDSSRAVFFRELAPIVKGMSMYDAVLEVNHWCHEKAVYQPTDSRTCSPLSIVRTAYGRCGEESTFLVAALRSVGIPARQVYTPRWAHTDDNHAWVEAWVDGKWHFLGACEPEPVLDLGWFNAPASRGMLMHTKVFGRYDGPEEVVSETPCHTEINVIGNYASDASRLDVRIVASDGMTPVPGARVEYRLYNYAEFYPVAVKTADCSGRSSLTAGSGDMVVYATDGNMFGLEPVSFGDVEELTVRLSYSPGDAVGHIGVVMVPPEEKANLPEVTETQRAENLRRMASEDSVRTAYTASFMSEEDAAAFVSSCTIPSRASGLLVSSRGNHAAICAFLKRAVRNGRGEDAVRLLESVSVKDLRDTPERVFEDHLYNTVSGADAGKVLSPRVSTELLTEYRGYFRRRLPPELAEKFSADPASLAVWCRENLMLADSVSMPYVQIAPVRVWETRLADKESRDIFFVALCRSLGISAWKDKVTGTVRYEAGGKEYDVDFDASVQTSSPKGRVCLSFSPIRFLDDPEYYIHFSLSKWEDGTFRLLNYPDGTTWKSVFAKGAELDCGYYMLTSGVRMSGGDVLADVEFFSVKEGSVATVPLILREDTSGIRVIGNFNSEVLYDRLTFDEGRFSRDSRGSVLSTTGRGYFTIVLADHGSEPTDHVLKDISDVAADMEEWGRPLLVIFASEAEFRNFDPSVYSLPSTVHYGIDSDGSVRSMIAEEMKTQGAGQLPLVLVGDTFNRVVFFSQGYSIGLGDRLVKTAKAL